MGDIDNPVDRATSRPEETWIISNGRFTDMDVGRICAEAMPGSAVEYQISDLARYMLSPDPIEVKKTLVGCEVRYHKPVFSRAREWVLNRLPVKTRGSLKQEICSREVLMAASRKLPPDLADRSLKAHFSRIEGLLSLYTPIARRLKALDLKTVEDMVGICEDLTRERTALRLEGAVEDRIDYVVRNVNQEVGVILGSAYIAEGLFEMRGFDFGRYDHGRAHRLVRFVQDGKTRACVLGATGDVEFWIADVKRIRYLQLLEQSIERNPELRDAFRKCADGYAEPFRLFFNRKLGIDYSQADPPEIYRSVFESCRLGVKEMDAVISSLSSLQIGISFTFVPRTESGERRVYACLSVMHNVRALEPIRADLPQLYSEISKMAATSEAGRFYLLDSAAGYQNAQ